MQGIRRGKMWAKIKVVIRHTVVEQRLFGLPVGCSDFPFCFEQCLYGALLESKRVRGFFPTESLVYLFAQVTKYKRYNILKDLKKDLSL